MESKMEEQLRLKVDLHTLSPKSKPSWLHQSVMLLQLVFFNKDIQMLSVIILTLFSFRGNVLSPCFSDL